MTKNPTPILVVAAAIADGSGRWLWQRRPPGKAHGGLWEFPGGKVEHGENPRAALVREIREELALTLDPHGLTPLAFAESPGGEGDPPIVILLYKAGGWSGSPAACEGGDWDWFTQQQARSLAKPPLDVELLLRFEVLLPSQGDCQAGDIPLCAASPRP